MRRTLFALIVFAAAAIALWWFLGGPRQSERNPFLALIPADTPYFALDQERVPYAIAKAHLARAALRREAIAALLLAGLTLVSGEVEAATRDRLLAALPEKFDEEGLGRLGLAVNFHFAFYAVGRDPVFRLELADRARARAAIAAFLPLPEANERAGGEWWRFRSDVGEVHVLLKERELLLAATSALASEEHIAALLGEIRPVRSFADDDHRLRRLRALLGVGPHWLGELDLQRFARRLAASASEGEACAPALASLSEHAGEFGFGLSRLSANEMEAVFAWRLPPANSPRGAAPPTPPTDALLRLAVAAADAEAVRTLLESLAQALDACGPAAALAPIAQALKERVSAFAPHRELAASLAVHDLHFLAGRPALSLSAVILSGDDQPPSPWVGALGLLLPLDQLATLPADGAVRPIGSQAQLGGLYPAFASARAGVLGISFGDQGGARLLAHMAGAPMPTGTIFEVGLRGALVESVARESAAALRWVPGAEERLARWQERGALLDRLDLSLRREENGLRFVLSAHYR